MKLRLALAIPLFAALAGCGSEDSPVDHLPAVDPGAGIVTASYSGRALYRGTKAPVSDITVQVTGAKDDGSPTDDVFGTTHADARGRFTVTSTAPRGQKVALVAAAVEESADTSGDRRAEGYEIKKHETMLGSLPYPSATGSNILLVESRRPSQGHNQPAE